MFSKAFVLKVIGITGTFCAGSGTAASFLGELLHAPVASYSDKLRDVLLGRGLEPNRQNLHDLGNELRGRDAQALSKLVVKEAKAASTKFFVAEKIRSMGDYNALKNEFGGDFLLLSMDAPLEVRYRRSLSRGRKGEHELSLEQFAESESKENNPRAAEGEMNIAALMRIADYLVVNNGTEEELVQKLREFAAKFGLLG